MDNSVLTYESGHQSPCNLPNKPPQPQQKKTKKKSKKDDILEAEEEAELFWKLDPGDLVLKQFAPSMVSLYSCEWNPNRRASTWFAYGGTAGLLQLVQLKEQTPQLSNFPT